MLMEAGSFSESTALLAHGHILYVVDIEELGITIHFILFIVAIV